MEKHEFALFIESLSSCTQEKKIGNNVTFSDEKLLHRIMNVLRLKIHDTCILFDRQIQILAKIISFTGKKQFSVEIQSFQKNIVLQPTITFLLPLLKRDDYEAALYALTEVGVNTIQLVFTQKTTHQWGNKDRERAERILIAAAEQSKNFSYPLLQEPISLDAALTQHAVDCIKLFFDPAGKKLYDVMALIQAEKTHKIVLLVGPEGDLSLEEKELVRKKAFIFCALTPTVIRAFQAASLGAGFVRSM